MVLDRKELGIIGLISVLFFIGNSFSSAVNIAAILVIYAYMWFTDKESALCLVFFLIPNIRIVDNIGSFTGFINIAFLLAGLKWIMGEIHTINTKGLFAVMTAVAFSVIHIGMVGNPLSYLLDVLNLAVDLIVMVAVLYSIFQNEDSNLDTDRVVRYLALGVLASMVIYTLVNSTSISDAFSSNLRLDGYGDDPNYYSIYILVAVAFLSDRLRRSEKKVVDVVLICMLTVIGLFTFSKMFFCGMLILMICFVLSVCYTRNKNGFQALLLCCLAGGILFIIKREDILYLLDKVVNRFSEISNTSHSVVYELTTGRSMLYAQYWHIFWSDPVTCFFGRGIAYNHYLAPLFNDTRVAHNTYMDLFLSWGLVGGCLFLALLIGFLEETIPRSIKFGYRYMPLIIFGFTIFTLSCLTADMFWYMLLLVLLPLWENREGE